MKPQMPMNQPSKLSIGMPDPSGPKTPAPFQPLPFGQSGPFAPMPAGPKTGNQQNGMNQNMRSRLAQFLANLRGGLGSNTGFM